MINPWQTLGIHKGTSKEDIAIAYKNIMRKEHPDVGGSQDKAIEASEARDLLLDRKKFSAYMAHLEVVAEPCSGCRGKGYHSKAKGLTGRITTPCPSCGGCGATIKPTKEQINDTVSV